MYPFDFYVVDAHLFEPDFAVENRVPIFQL